MCGRFNLRVPLSVLARQFQFDLEGTPPIAIRYNIAPTQEVAAVRLAEGKRQFMKRRSATLPKLPASSPAVRKRSQRMCKR